LDEKCIIWSLGNNERLPSRKVVVQHIILQTTSPIHSESMPYTKRDQFTFVCFRVTKRHSGCLPFISGAARN
jgi:hypothetical protein